MSVVNVLMLKALWFQKKVWCFCITFLPVSALHRSCIHIEPFLAILCALASLAFRCFCDGFFFTGLPVSILASFSKDFQLLLHVLRCTFNPRQFAFSQGLFLVGTEYTVWRRIRNGGIMPQEKNNTNFLPLFPSNPKQPRDKNVTFPSTDPMDVTFLMFFSARVQPPCRSTPLHGSFFLKGGEGKSSCLIAVENFNNNNNNNNMFSNKLCCYCVDSTSCIIYMYISI